MGAFVFVALFAGICVSAQDQPPANGAKWMLEYEGKSENELARDPRLEQFLMRSLPTTELPSFHEPVNHAAVRFIWGVPGILWVKTHRYVIASGCPAHACVERGLLWVDVQNDTTVFVATRNEEENSDRTTSSQYPIASTKLVIATKADLSPEKLPDSLRGAIIEWLHIEGVLRLREVTLLTPRGVSAITTDQLCWSGPCSQVRWQ